MDEIDVQINRNKEFVRKRITELRIKKNIAEYQMSYELGQNKSYIQSITSGKAMPSMAGFFNICDYFGITPSEFFDESIHEPDLLHELTNNTKFFSEEDLQLIIEIAKRLKK